MSTNPFDFISDATGEQSFKTALVYDRACERHESNEAHPECPDRVKLPLKHLRHCGLLDRFVWLGKVEPCSRERLLYAHHESYVESMLRTMQEHQNAEQSVFVKEEPTPAEEVNALLEMCLETPVEDPESSADSMSQPSVASGIEDRSSDLHDRLPSESPGDASQLTHRTQSDTCGGDIYYNAHTKDACLHAAGGAAQAALAIARGEVDNALCVLRPPGHHAGPRNASGFCMFNNVAIAARTLQKEVKGMKKVVIFDWDVHHGDGTEKIFYDDPSVLCISIHQYARGHPHRFHRSSLQYRMGDTYRMLSMEGEDDGSGEEENEREGESRGEHSFESHQESVRITPKPEISRPEIPLDSQPAKRSRRDRGAVDYALLEANLQKEKTEKDPSGDTKPQSHLAAFLSNSVTTFADIPDDTADEEDESYDPDDYDELSGSSSDTANEGYDTAAPSFYPGTGHTDDTGAGPGRGYNVNIPLPCHGFGDMEYCTIMQNLVLPLIVDFKADFIIIAGGFDAVQHDTLGNMELTPSGYAMMTRMLMDVMPHGRVLCALEGGYNVPQVSLCVEAVARTLLGASGEDKSRMLLHRAKSLVDDVWEKLAKAEEGDEEEEDSSERSARAKSRPAMPDMQLGPFLS